MAKLYSGGVTIATGFKRLISEPICDDEVVQFVADLATIPNQFIGMETFVAENQTKYVKKSTGWEPFLNNPTPPVVILDPVPSIVVTTNIETLVKDYNIGSFAGKKMLNLKFLFHKTILANETINGSIRLFNTVTSVETNLGLTSSNTFSVFTALERQISLDEANNQLYIIDPSGTFFSDSAILNNNISTVPVSFSNPYRLRVYMRSSFTGTGIRQCSGVINLR